MKSTTPIANLAASGLVVLLGLTTRASEPLTVTLKDWTGRGFAPDLVNYTIPTPADGGKSLRVLDAAGKSVPVQLTPGTNGQATLSFVAEIPANGTSTYSIRTDGQGPAAPAAVSATRDGDALILANQLLAVRVPFPMEVTYDRPETAELPAPILAFRGPDGAWRGAGSMVHQTVKAVHITQTANGPVFTEVHYRLDYAGGGFYAATIRVTDQAPFAQVSEEYELGVSANAHFWQLDLSKGWKPDAAEHMNVAGQGYIPVTYPSLADEEKTTTSGPSVGADLSSGVGKPTRCIHHDSCWGSRFVSLYGIYQAEARKANPENYPLVMVAPLHKGEWRRANSLPVYVKNGEVTVRFPMDVAPISWINEPGSDVSPFSCHEHDPNLPITYARRVWALVLAQPTLKVIGYNNPQISGIGYSVRDLYGVVGLDRYKDYVLNWPDGKVVYPRVFLTPADVQKYRTALQADPSFPLLPLVQKYYWFTGDPETARKEIPDVHKRLQLNIEYIMTSLSIHHHHTIDAYGEPIGHAESVLAWPDLPATDRELIRARLALLSYLLVEPDVTSAGDGSHHGNPNMGVSRLMDRSNLVALIPDHPMFKTWRDYMSRFMAYKAGTFMAPEGGWCEYGGYHMHGYSKLLRGMMGVINTDAPENDLVWKYNRADFDYYLNLLSPIDPRYGTRAIPGTANSPTVKPPYLMQAMGSVADRDPVFAANLRWGWDASGQMLRIIPGGDIITLPAMGRPWIAPQDPKLTSRIFPGYGVIFRAHEGNDETALYLRSGYLWSHWSHDQGNLTLFSKGAVLMPGQPYGYGGPKDKGFPDKSFLRFGSPVNDIPNCWTDSNILDSHFSPSVDYAWSSSGYPDWFINPGYTKGWPEKPRDLVAGLDQKEGAFTWDRQIAFLKGATGKSPNYFVIRDSMNGAPSTGSGQGGKLASWFNLSLLGRTTNVQVTGEKVMLDTEWPTKLELLFPGRKELPFEMRDDNLRFEFASNGKIATNRAAGEIISRDWLDKDGKPAVVSKPDRFGVKFNGVLEQHVALRLQSAPGQEIAWVLYPRGAGETAPTATPLAPSVTKVVTAESTDYVFLSTTPLAYAGDGVEFVGLAGAVRVAKDGKVTLVLSAGPGKVSYKGHVIESPIPFERIVSGGAQIEKIPAPTWAINAQVPPVTVESNRIRFVVAEHKYVELTHGNVGVRGVGPFDLTLTPEGITGKVDGDIRTIVTTWPAKITRPMYRMDGVRWYAGFADEHSITKGTTAPQFCVAIGVSAGLHTVKISEWEWLELPPMPARAKLSPTN